VEQGGGADEEGDRAEQVDGEAEQGVVVDRAVGVVDQVGGADREDAAEEVDVVGEARQVDNERTSGPGGRQRCAAPRDEMRSSCAKTERRGTAVRGLVSLWERAPPHSDVFRIQQVLRYSRCQLVMQTAYDHAAEVALERDMRSWTVTDGTWR
jgi:hypothetical protein